MSAAIEHVAGVAEESRQLEFARVIESWLANAPGGTGDAVHTFRWTPMTLGTSFGVLRLDPEARGERSRKRSRGCATKRGEEQP